MHAITLYYSTMQSQDNLAIDPAQEESRLQVSSRPRNRIVHLGVGPSQRGKDERRIGGKEKKVKFKMCFFVLHQKMLNVMELS